MDYVIFKSTMCKRSDLKPSTRPLDPAYFSKGAWHTRLARRKHERGVHVLYSASAGMLEHACTLQDRAHTGPGGGGDPDPLSL